MVNAFQKTFTSMMTSANIKNSFTTAKPSYMNGL